MIYAITCFEKLEMTPLRWPSLGARAFMGYYTDKETAYEAVRENSCDINETIYDYAVVETIEEGLYPFTMERQFFKFNKEDGHYHEIDEPNILKHIANIL